MGMWYVVVILKRTGFQWPICWLHWCMSTEYIELQQELMWQLTLGWWTNSTQTNHNKNCLLFCSHTQSYPWIGIPELKLADFLFPLLIRNCRVGKLVLGLYLSAVGEVRLRWDSHCKAGARMSGHYYYHHWLFIWVWPQSQATDHLRQELFVVIFTASCQQELNLS